MTARPSTRKPRRGNVPCLGALGCPVCCRRGRVARLGKVRSRLGLKKGRLTTRHLVRRLMLPQADYQIDNPAAPDMRAGAATVGQQVGVLAPRILEGVGQYR